MRLFKPLIKGFTLVTFVALCGALKSVSQHTAGKAPVPADMLHLRNASLFVSSVSKHVWAPQVRFQVCPSPSGFRRGQTLAMSENKTSAIRHDVIAGLRETRSRISAVLGSIDKDSVELVAVSKTKPIGLLLEVYREGQRHFGENYVQEVVQKASEMPDDVQWHFIGNIQSNKAKALASIPNMYVVETVDRQKIASALNNAVESTGRQGRLRVMVQVNTSGEQSKFGCGLGDTAKLAEFVENECEHLELLGLMTIGAPDTSEEPDAFRKLAAEREAVAAALGRDAQSLKLSMGMSGDFEAAIRMGSDSVRVGSTIFGAREYPRKD